LIININYQGFGYQYNWSLNIFFVTKIDI